MTSAGSSVGVGQASHVDLPDRQEVALLQFDNAGFSRGRSLAWEIAWTVVETLFVASVFPGSPHRRMLLRLFGAKIGAGVVLKPGIRIKFPWRLEIGDHSWIGERVWIDNLAPVRIASNCCISQGAYLCTGNHDRTRRTFDLVTGAIVVEDFGWVGAFSLVGPNVVVGKGAMLAMGSVATSDLESWTIYRGNPAVRIKARVILAE